MIKSRIQLIISIGTHHSRVGNRVSIKCTEEEINTEILTGKGSSFDNPIKKESNFSTVFVTGDYGQAKEVAKRIANYLTNTLTVVEKMNSISMKYLYIDNSKEIVLEKIKEACNSEIPESKPFTPILMVYKEKHCTQYYLLTSPENSYKTCLNVLTQRHSENWYSYLTYDSKEEDFYTLKEIEELPISMEKIKNELKEKFQERQQRILRKNENKRLYNSIEKAIKENNGILAIDILTTLSNGEYENIEFIEFQTF